MVVVGFSCIPRLTLQAPSLMDSEPFSAARAGDLELEDHVHAGGLFDLKGLRAGRRRPTGRSALQAAAAGGTASGWEPPPISISPKARVALENSFAPFK